MTREQAILSDTMSPNSTKSEFTIRSANQTLPLVKMIVQDIVCYSSQIRETRERLDYLNDGRSGNANDDYSLELQSIEASVDEKVSRMEQCIQELNDLNIRTTNVTDGFVDFPARREGETVYLCWQLGDREIMFWHHLEEDCSVRRTIDLSLIRQSGDSCISEN